MGDSTGASPIAVMLARRQHLAEIPQVELAAATLFSEADLPNSLRYKVTHISYLREALEQECLWVALNGESVVGFAAASVIDGVGYLDEIDVLPEFGRRGIGTRLIAMAVEWARSKKFECLMLITFRHLPWNAPLYEKLGFRGMDSSEHGTELAALFRKEHRIGLNIASRIAMRMDL